MADPRNTCAAVTVSSAFAAVPSGPRSPGSPLVSRSTYVTSNSDTCYDADVAGWVFRVGETRGGGHAASDVACGRTIRGNDRWAQRALAKYLLAGPRDPSRLLHGVLTAPERLRPQ